MTVSTIIRKLRNACFVAMYHILCILPIQDKIIFSSEGRSQLSGNMKYIYDELNTRETGIRSVVMVRDKKQVPPSLRYFARLAYQCATSKFIIIDDFYPRMYKLRIRKQANLMQVWHAVGAFKQFGYARVGLPGGPDPNSINHRNYTQVIVSSQSVVPVYAQSFGVSEQVVLPLGVPRTDYFYDRDAMAASRAQFYLRYPNLRGKRIVMFAPTFRGPGQMTAYYPMEWIDLEALYERIQDTDVAVVFKFHPYVKERLAIPDDMKDHLIDLSDYREINDLLVVADQLITDYSSSIFEYSLLDRKIIFFSPDLDEYDSDRSFYFDYRSFVPGPICQDFQALLDEIMNRSYDKQQLIDFKNRFFTYQDGKSSARVVDYIIGKLEEK